MDSDDVEFTAEKVSKFKEYMSNEKRDVSYLMAFGTFAGDWKISDVHVSEDLLSVGTFELIDLFFSKGVDVMFIWRIDRKDITEMEIKTIHDYVVHDMEDFMSEGEGDRWKSIHRYLTEGKKCLVLSYDHPALDLYGSDASFWSISADDVYDHAVGEAEKIATGDETYHDDLMDVMTGKKQSGQHFDDLDKRRKI
jgi:hypothetical protein